MRPTILILLLGLSLSSRASAQNWIALPLASTDDVLAIERGSFADVWLVGRNGLIAHSNFDRTIWTVEDVFTSQDLHSVVRQTSVQVWASGVAGTVRVKNNAPWAVADIGLDERFVLYSRGSGVAHAVGDSGSIFRSLDFGSSWSPQVSGTSMSLNHGTGFNTGSSWIVGDGGTILATVDGGETWTPQPSGTSANLNFIIQTGTWLIVAGDNGTILRSNDSGATWSQSATNVSANLNALAPSVFDAGIILACGDGGTLVRTTDFGATWCAIETETTTNLHAVCYPALHEIIIGGDGGFLERSTNDGGACVVPTAVAPSSPSSFAMRGPYPQPVRGRSVLSLTSDRSQPLTVTAHDVRGRRVTKLFDGHIEAGRQLDLFLDTRDWPTGVYFVRAAGPRVLETRKVVVLE